MSILCTYGLLGYCLPSQVQFIVSSQVHHRKFSIITSSTYHDCKSSPSSQVQSIMTDLVYHHKSCPSSQVQSIITYPFCHHKFFTNFFSDSFRPRHNLFKKSLFIRITCTQVHCPHKIYASALKCQHIKRLGCIGKTRCTLDKTNAGMGFKPRNILFQQAGVKVD